MVFGVDQPDQQGDEDLGQRRCREVDAEDARLLAAQEEGVECRVPAGFHASRCRGVRPPVVDQKRRGPLFCGVGHVSGPLFTGEPDKDEFGEVRGTVYIVESLSPDPNIVALKGRLYKIGFTTQSIEKRLADVEKDPTFLCAKVQLRATFDTNFSPRKLEQLLHQFFAHANLQVEVVLGKRVVPKEWFVVPLHLVEEAVARILDRSIVNYRYDSVSRKISPR